MLRLLRNRDLALLVSGQAVSDLGDGIFAVALAWRVYQSYSSPFALSVVGIAFFLPRVVGTLAGGVISDRFERRWTMISADCVRGLAVGALAFIDLSGGQELYAISTVAAIQGLAGSLFGPSESALLPEVVSAEDLTRANSLRTLVTPLANAVVGPAVGGAITAAAGPASAFLVDAGTYFVSVVTLLLMSSRSAGRDSQRRSLIADAREGFAYVARRPWLWGPILTASIAQFLYAGPNQSLVPYLVKFELHASAAALGAVFACAGIGTVAAGLVIGRLPRPRNIVLFMILGWSIGIAAVALVGLSQTVWQAAASVFAWNFFLWGGEILWLTLLGLTVPNRLRGRVSSIDFVGSYWLIPLSMALTGPMAALIGPRTVLVVAGIAGGLIILSSLLVPNILRPTYLEAHRTEAT